VINAIRSLIKPLDGWRAGSGDGARVDPRRPGRAAKSPIARNSHVELRALIYNGRQAFINPGGTARVKKTSRTPERSGTDRRLNAFFIDGL
jgi:hypothetical protein